ncbi:replication initiator [Nocardioides sp. NPDC047086]|uniref:replication initiator n=1 Tax=Nocardioides sp. NPDC047086 TaxID=3154810 RepID=UPI0033EE975A
MTISTMDAPGIHSDGPSASGFPGYGEGAPLDLPGLTPDQATSMLARWRDGTFDAFAETLASVNNCAHPIRLTGSSETYDLASGDLVGTYASANAPLGVLFRPCGNRRAEVCPACSRTYARDTFAMINAGLVGGKTIPATVADNPLLFATFTAPSFGPVHTHFKNGSRCHPRNRDRGARCEHGRPISCMARHAEDDSIVGAPFCSECHDTDSAIIWQWHAPELWRRLTIELRRAVARALGVTESALKKHAAVQFAKVAEYQARGLVHFHALIRLDGPDGPGSPAPLDGHALAGLVKHAAGAVTYTAPPVDHDDVARLLRWGKQLDVRVVRDGHRTDDPDSPLVPEQVAGYLAKYATKDANSIRSAESQRPHLAAMNARCHSLAMRAMKHYGIKNGARKADAKKSDPVNPYDLLGKWAHMLGFRGHFSTKSRRYSISLGRLRRARARYAEIRAAAEHNEQARATLLDLGELEAWLLADEETTLVIGNWTFDGIGWPSPGDETLALAAAARAREYDQWRAQTNNTNR